MFQRAVARFPHADLVLPVFVAVVVLLLLYALLMVVMLVVCRRNLLLLERIRVKLQESETKYDMTMRNIANERVLENNRVSRVIESIVDVLKE